MIWVKRILTVLAAVAVWAVLTAAFISKERLCNMAVNSAAEKAGVTLCFDGYGAGAFGCGMKHITLLYGHSPVAKIKKADFSLWKMEASDIRLEGIAADMMPEKIETVTFLPLSGKIRSTGDFGVLDGNISLSGRKIMLELKPSSLMKRRFSTTLRTFRYRNGKYTYAISF